MTDDRRQINKIVLPDFLESVLRRPSSEFQAGPDAGVVKGNRYAVYIRKLDKLKFAAQKNIRRDRPFKPAAGR